MDFDVDDTQLMVAIQAGQLDLFDLIVRRYRGALHRAALSKLGDPAWAEDVVQDTFLAVFAARHTYRPDFSFRTWLWTILLNLCARQWKRRELRGRELVFSRLEAGELPAASEPLQVETGLTVLLRAERREQLDAALARLPEVQADALRLRFFGELKFHEIALAMDSSIGAAKVRVKHGLEALARMFEKPEGDIQ